MKKIIKLYLGGSGTKVAIKYPNKKDIFVLIRDGWNYDECLSKKIPCMDMYVDCGLDGDYDWKSRFEEYKEHEEEIINIITKYDKVLLICGLGGGTGSSLYIYLSNLCKKIGIECDAIVTFPFDFEGYRRTFYASKALNMGSVNNIIPIDLPFLKCKKIIPGDTPMLDAFVYIDYLICEFIKCYEENDINSNEIKIYNYREIIDSIDKNWIKKTRGMMRERGELWEQRK